MTLQAQQPLDEPLHLASTEETIRYALDLFVTGVTEKVLIF
jgi:hypothetical protein